MAFLASADDGVSGLGGVNFTDASGTAEIAGAIGHGDGAGNDGVYGDGSANGVHGEALTTSSGSGVFGENQGNGNGVFGHASNAAASVGPIVWIVTERP